MKKQITEEIRKEFAASEVEVSNIDFVKKTGYDWFARIVVDGVSCKVSGAITGSFYEVAEIVEWV